ncbi:MAG: deoxyuridine 5'-triphosphate nucleotidohydrolase [Clostridiaceae bacterium]|nr:deoxyuridine 5'-triphosphate nucleotidohydrolase [Clostridiaceae bacterium]
MNRIAKFDTVSEEQFRADATAAFKGSAAFLDDVIGANEVLYDAYDNLKLPSRATSGSAGYDFFTPFAVTLAPEESVSIPTGIRVKIDVGWALFILPKSGLGFKYRLQLDNTVGLIDSDYYGAQNEGHIIVKISNLSLEKKALELKRGMAFAQGVFLPYGITADDATDGIRTGGFGSTSNR